MKNKKILPNTLVPKRLRLKVYQEAYDRLKNETKVAIGLCVSLPMYLWGLKWISDTAPNGRYWYTEDTLNMFPELAKELTRLKDLGRIKHSYMLDDDRIDFLEKVLNINQPKTL